MQEGFRAIGDTEALKKIVHQHEEISIRHQCELLGLNRGMLYYQPVEESVENLEMMQVLDKEHYRHPTKGVETMVVFLVALGYQVGPKRVRRLMRKMRLQAIYPQKNLSKLGFAKYVHPYRLRKLEITHSNQVWSIDITYIPMKKGFLNLTAIIDVYSRYIVGWGLSNTLDGENTLNVLQQAIAHNGKPEIINSDQGSQFTCHGWVNYLNDLEIQISMDGKGRCLGNIWIERFWRTLKREHVYLWPAENGQELYRGIADYIRYYNNERHHKSLNYSIPYDWYKNAA